MRRLVILLALASLASALLVASPSSAGAGGFCAGGMFTDARGTTVELSNYCMTPTILRVNKGAEVTFHNVDPDLHMLGGVNNVFGNMHTEIKPDEAIAYTFNDEGVFPYVCILHPGMAGAIVVGDGAGKVSNASVTGGTIVPPSDETSATDDAAEASAGEEPVTQPTSSNQPGNLWLLAALVVAMSGAFWWQRRKPSTNLSRGAS